MIRRLLPDATVAVTLAAALGYLLAVPGNTAFWASNVSLTWLLLPFWFGWRVRDTKAGAVIGLGMTWLCLAAYYVPPVLLLQGGNTDLVTRFGSRYFILGAVSGPVLGALGAWWQRHPIYLIPLGVAGLGLAERWAWQWRVGFVGAPTVFTTEAIAAALLALAMAVWARHARTAPATIP